MWSKISHFCFIACFCSKNLNNFYIGFFFILNGKRVLKKTHTLICTMFYAPCMSINVSKIQTFLQVKFVTDLRIFVEFTCIKLPSYASFYQIDVYILFSVTFPMKTKLRTTKIL